MKSEAPLTALVSRLLQALRVELEAYGEMLALLDQQQESVMERAGDQVLQSAQAIDAQGRTLRAVRQQREALHVEVARAVQQAHEPSLVALLPWLPETQRVAVAALVRENNQLLVRVQQRARQNHVLLGRSLELMRSLLHSLQPASTPTTYTGQGTVLASALATTPLCDAVV
jgi:flagellar biosynthesis/type III secretory pathway chaperone